MCHVHCAMRVMCIYLYPYASRGEVVLSMIVALRRLGLLL